MKKFWVGLLVLASVIVHGSPLFARVLLKPAGKSSMPLYTRSVSADVVISGQFATTNLDLIYQNESSDKMEAEFIYELPQGAVATYFAYWAGEEKVVARIVEKEEAKKIYETIAYSWNRDPALIEMTGKNTFRARIFPVFPNSDFEVEIHIVQALPSDINGAVYSLPIFEKDALDPLDSINAKILVKPDAAIGKVTTNYGIPVQCDAEGYKIDLSGEDFRPRKDLNVRITPKPEKLHTSLYAAPSGGEDGYFSLVLTPDHSLTNPSITIDGVKTYEISPTRLSRVKAYSPLIINGRYKGSGKATVTLRGKSTSGWVIYSAPVLFGSEPEQNNPATKLWAKARIEQLSASKAKRSAVISISKRFGIPSKYTSWLAVPKEEMKFYKQDENHGKIDAVALPLIDLIKQNKENTDQGKALTDRLDKLCSEIGLDPKEELRNRAYDFIDNIQKDIAKDAADGKDITAQNDRLVRLFGTEPYDTSWILANELAKRIVEQEHSDKPDAAKVAELKNRLEQLTKSTNTSINDCMEYANRQFENEKSNQAALQLLNLLKTSQGNSPEAENLRKELVTYGHGSSPIRYYLISAIRDTCDKLPELIKSGGDAEAAITQMQNEFEPAADESGLNLRYVISSYIGFEVRRVAENFAEAVAQGRESTEEGQVIDKQLAVLSRISRTDSKETFGDSASYKLANLAQDLVGEQYKAHPDKRIITDLKQQIKRLEVRSGRSAADDIRKEKEAVLKDELWQVEDSLADIMIDGKGNTKTGKAIRTRFHTLCAQLCINPKEELNGEIADKTNDILLDYENAKYMDHQDTIYLSQLKRKLKSIENLTGIWAQDIINRSDEYSLWYALEPLQESLIAEMQRDKTNKARLLRLQKRYQSLSSLYTKYAESIPGYPVSINEYISLLNKTVDLRLKSMALAKQIQLAQPSGDNAKLAQLQESQKQITASFNNYVEQLDMHARYGDPMIAVDAPADALRVVAVMPDGEIKTLEYNTDTKKWEVRFDIPSYETEGEYTITVIVVLKDGVHKQMKLHYNVDLTPPTGKANAIVAGNARLDISTDKDTARVTALLPWGERVEMRTSSEPGKFYANIPVPDNYRNTAFAVSYVLTDRAHNRTTITVDARPE